MIGSFSFNNVESSVYDLVCKSVKRPLLPAVKVNRTEIPGTSGSHDTDSNEYSLRPITMKIAYIGTSFEELRSRARQIAAWLSTGYWVKLIINDEPDKYYLARVTNEIDLVALWGSGTADISFDCQPFAYSVTESVATTTATGAKTLEFEHPGTRLINFRSPQGSKSLITVTGTWSTITLAMNGSSLTFGTAGSGSTLIVDNVELETSKDSVNSFSNLTGDIDKFLPIIPGVNALSIGGTGLNISIEVKFIPMWI